MNRSEAIACAARQKGASGLRRSSTHFANINAAKEVWWLEIPQTKLAQAGDLTINLLLYDSRSGILHHLQVPKLFFETHEKQLVIRPEKACLVLELSSEKARQFRDVRPGGDGIEFRPFLKASWGGDDDPE
ncbi:MAG: hypothetical protein AABO41_13345 [Acidobacteriota bacterium]